jgi:hypothetical protein
VISVKGIRDPIVAVVISTSCYFQFILHVLTLTALRVIGLHWWGLSSHVLSCVGSALLLGASSIGGIVLCIARGVTSNDSSWVGCCIGSDVGSGVYRLCDFIFASSLFSQGLKGGIVVMSLPRSLQPTPRVGACG